MLIRILRDADPADPTGGNNADPNADPKGKDGPDLDGIVKNLVKKHGSETEVLRVLLGETYTLRDKNRELKSSLPPEGSVILTGDKAKDWSAYQDLGKVADLRQAITDRDQFKASATNLLREKEFKVAADLTTIDGSKLDAGVLTKLANADKIELVIGEAKDKKTGKVIEKDGKAVQAAFVKGEGDEVTSLDEYAKANWEAFLPSLKLTQAQRPNGTPNPGKPQGLAGAQGAGVQQVTRVPSTM